MCDVKKEIKERARLSRVLANALGHDAEYIYSDAENYDLSKKQKRLYKR